MIVLQAHTYLLLWKSHILSLLSTQLQNVKEPVERFLSTAWQCPTIDKDRKSFSFHFCPTQSVPLFALKKGPPQSSVVLLSSLQQWRIGTPPAAGYSGILDLFVDGLRVWNSTSRAIMVILSLQVLSYK